MSRREIITDGAKPRKNTFLKRFFGLSNKSTVRRGASTVSVASRTPVSTPVSTFDRQNHTNSNDDQCEIVSPNNIELSKPSEIEENSKEMKNYGLWSSDTVNGRPNALTKLTDAEFDESELDGMGKDTSVHLHIMEDSIHIPTSDNTAVHLPISEESKAEKIQSIVVNSIDHDNTSENTLARQSDTSSTPASPSRSSRTSPDSLETEHISTDLQQQHKHETPVETTEREIDDSDDMPPPEDEEQPSCALQIYDGTANFIAQDEYASWLGTSTNEEILKEYMSLFDFKGLNILASLRLLCDKIYMRAESQQLHRIMEEFGKVWYNDNETNGFGDAAAVYTIAYSILLLNTDLYAADHTTKKKINKSQFAHNTLQALFFQRELPKDQGKPSTSSKRLSFDGSRGLGSNEIDLMVKDYQSTAFSKDWEKDVDTILRAFYTSISQQPLKLSVIESDTSGSSVFHDDSYSSSISASKRPGSITGGPTAVVDVNLNTRPQTGSHSFSLLSRMTRLRKAHDHHESRIGTSTLDEFASGSMKGTISSNFSMNTGLSLFGINRQAVGFAGLLWNSMKEQDEIFEEDEDQPFDNFAQLKNEISKEEERELQGAPWVKEGISLYRPYTDPNTGKKNRKKTWKQMFTVVQRGQVRMFSFDNKSRRHGVQVGDGNWTDHAEFVDGFHLCHTMAQEAPSSTNISQFNSVWSLTLPQRGLLVFRTGTPEIAREFVYTCNYWAARLSKEPFEESISSMEYGWSIQPEEMKMGSDSKKPGDKMTICEWQPAGQSLLPSDLTEEAQLKNLRDYVAKTEKQLAQHNALRTRILESFSPTSQNMTKAQSNWERKSQYLLQQVIRFQVYADTLQQAIDDGKTKGLSKGGLDGGSKGSNGSNGGLNGELGNRRSGSGKLSKGELSNGKQGSKELSNGMGMEKEKGEKKRREKEKREKEKGEKVEEKGHLKKDGRVEKRDKEEKKGKEENKKREKMKKEELEKGKKS